MPFLLGTDEAGYGPNLGPLTIGSTAWYVPPAHASVSLYDLLAEEIAAGKEKKSSLKLPIADSKKLYSASGSIALLEQAILGAAAFLGHAWNDWHSLWSGLRAQSPAQLAAIPWHADYHLPLPHEASVDQVALAQAALANSAERTGAHLVHLQAVAVYPQDFNARLLRVSSKGELLSQATMQLVQDNLHALRTGPHASSKSEDNQVTIYCDKHGGRDRYAGMLQHLFGADQIHIGKESRDESIYRFSHEGWQLTIHFTAKGEKNLPTALASMIAKYLREISMLPFNDFFIRHLPSLRPTAGYPEDAKRFAEATATLRKQLALPDEIFWRNK